MADKGYSQAQLSIGLFYENGVIVKENLDKAFKYYKMAAEQDNDEAMVCYASVLLRKDKEQNQINEAIEWYRKAAERKNLRGQFLLAIILLASKDEERQQEGILWLQQSAHEGYPDAMYVLATEYVFGRFVPQDNKKAFDLMEKAALEKGSIKAVDVLGDFYFRGIGVERDVKRAIICYSIGAENHIPNSMYWYGRFLCDGVFIEQDVAKGYPLVKEAAEMGNTDAMVYIGLDYYRGEFVKKNDKEAFYWVEKAVKEGETSALVILGEFYMQGIGVVADKAKAVELYKKSAAQKDPYGVFRLGQILYEEKGADSQTGLNLIKVAAKMGNEPAQEYLNKLGSLDNNEEDDDFENDSAQDDEIDDLDEDPFE